MAKCRTNVAFIDEQIKIIERDRQNERIRTTTF